MEKLSNSYHFAKQRLENTENKLKKTPEVMRMYTETLDKYLEKGYITKIRHKTEAEKGCYYIPHFQWRKWIETQAKQEMHLMHQQRTSTMEIYR